MDKVVGPNLLSNDSSVLTRNLAQSVTGGLTSAAVRAAFGGKIDMVAVMTDAFANAVGNSIVEGVSSNGLEEIAITAQRMPEPDPISTPGLLGSNPELATTALSTLDQFNQSTHADFGSSAQSPFVLNASEPTAPDLSDPIETIVVTGRRINAGEDAGLDVWWWANQYRAAMSSDKQALLDQMGVDAGANFLWRERYGRTAGWLTDRVGAAYDALTDAPAGSGEAWLAGQYGGGQVDGLERIVGLGIGGAQGLITGTGRGAITTLEATRDALGMLVYGSVAGGALADQMQGSDALASANDRFWAGVTAVGDFLSNDPVGTAQLALANYGSRVRLLSNVDPTSAGFDAALPFGDMLGGAAVAGGGSAITSEWLLARSVGRVDGST